jgi:hypothetical protein
MPTLYPPFDEEENMIPSTIRKSFETIIDISRLQEGCNIVQVQHDDEQHQDVVESSTSTDDSDEDEEVIQKDSSDHRKRKYFHSTNRRHSSFKKSPSSSPSKVYNSKELEAMKFEAALSAAVAVENEIQTLQSGIAELERMLLRCGDRDGGTDSNKNDKDNYIRNYDDDSSHTLGLDNHLFPVLPTVAEPISSKEIMEEEKNIIENEKKN